MTVLRKNLLVTGRPGVGKTTLIERVLDFLDIDAGGFYTSEMLDGGRRVGFSIVGLHGDSGVLAHVDHEGSFRVGKYGVNCEDLERVGVRAVDQALKHSRLIVMDEIGRMELCSQAFQEAVGRALDSPKPVLGTIQDRTNAFLDSVRARPDVEVLRVNTGNRECLVPILRDRMLELLGE
ncbi:MAG: NTPase [Candidatus Eisenbacteria sp.]|nr:NTPase [Candidatus Eisenbacteria bacterium]